MENKIIRTSWGYDMTHNDYAIIISENGKTALCQMIGAKKISGNGFAGSEIPDPSITRGKPFRLRVKDDNSYKGSYPFCWGRDDAKRMGWFSIWCGSTDYYNYMD